MPYTAHKLYSQELRDACLHYIKENERPEAAEYPYDETPINEYIDTNFSILEDHLIEKGFSQLEIDEMKFVPWRPNYGPNNDWIIPEGFIEYRLGKDTQAGMTIFVKKESSQEPYMRLLHKLEWTMETEFLMWKIYNMDSKNILIIDNTSAEWMTVDDIDGLEYGEPI